MKVLVCGSRHLDDPLFASLTIDAWLKGFLASNANVTVIHGAADGADVIAADAARRHGAHVEAFPVSDSDREGARAKGRLKLAPLYRNLRMLDEKPDLVVGFWNGASRGTEHTLREARKRGIPTLVVRIQRDGGGLE